MICKIFKINKSEHDKAIENGSIHNSVYLFEEDMKKWIENMFLNSQDGYKNIHCIHSVFKFSLTYIFLSVCLGRVGSCFFCPYKDDLRNSLFG